MATLEAPVRPRTSLHSGPTYEPFYDFRNEENARRMRAAISKVRAQLGRQCDLHHRRQACPDYRQDKVAESREAVGDRWYSSESRARSTSSLR